MPPQRRKNTIGGGIAVPARNPLADEAEHTPPVSPLRDAQWRGMNGPVHPMEPIPARPVDPAATRATETSATKTAKAVQAAVAAKSRAAAPHSRTAVIKPRIPAPKIDPDAATGPGAQPAPVTSTTARPATTPPANTTLSGTKAAKVATRVADSLGKPAGNTTGADIVVGPATPADIVVGPATATGGKPAEQVGGQPTAAETYGGTVAPVRSTGEGAGGGESRGRIPANRAVDAADAGGTVDATGAAGAGSVLSMELPEAGDGPLSSGELAQLEACESSIDALRVAFWTAGRALQIVRDGRLYRADHANFDDYVEKRWDMQRSYAHKLIRAWPLAARLHPVAPSINEGQIRELLPIAVAHGEDAAVTVYTTLAADVKVTANKLREALAVLPAHYDEIEAVERLQAWLRGDLSGLPPRNPNVFSTAETRLAVLTRRLVKGSSRDPLAARDFAAKLRGLAELIEQQIPASDRAPADPAAPPN
ncbi:hypothetical protein ABZ319_06260 [Nocardia sp. NPDC005978]|uniref:hypothetical protein n=1 Tax=Nocardia sp. NPDC005978 TaxID=3156725 RepID=UPI0033A1D6C9